MSDKSIQETYAPNLACFGCGPANEKGLHIRSFPKGEEVVADFQAETYQEAFPGMLSGGIIGTILDCHCNWSAAWHLMKSGGLDSPPCTVTADYTIKLFRPTPTDKPIHLVARVVESTEDRVIVEGELIAHDKICATCRGTFVAVKPGHPARPSPSPSPASVSQSIDCGCEDKPLPEVLAVVNGIRISRLDISEEIQRRIKERQQQVVDARAREVDLQINSILLEAEAKKRGVNTAKLLDAEVVAKTVAPSEAEARAFYDQNKARIDREFTLARQEIIDYLRDERQREIAKAFAARLRAAAALKISPEPVTPGLTAAARARVFATVNGRNITSADVEDNLKPLIFSVQESVYGLRKQEIELRINDAVLEQEAKKRAITTTSLFATEVTAKVPAISEAEAQKFYNENKPRINGEFAQLKTQIIDYLKQKALRNIESDFATRLRGAAQIQIFLTPPQQPVYQLAVDDQPTRGNATASVTVIEFTDFQCPSCAKQHPVVERLIAEYGTRVKFVVRDFPLAQYENSAKAAEAAEAAREQGKYWEYVKLLYNNQSALQVDRLKQYASTLGLDRGRFDAALDSGKFADKILRDRLDGQKVGASGAPVFFVNGRRVTDTSYEGLKTAIESSLQTR